MIDLRGKPYGRLVAEEPTEERYRGTCVVWRCRCECGQVVHVPSSLLRAGLVKSCGCLQDEARRTDITGQVRGQLTAICPTEQRDGGHTVWLWRCSCGATLLKTPQRVGARKSTMCPACSRSLKRQQMQERAARVQRDELGRSVRQVADIVAGKPTAQSTSGVRGVTWHKGMGKWCARITDGKGGTRTIGYYTTIDEAARARRLAVEAHYGKEDCKT